LTTKEWVSLLHGKRQGADGQYIAKCPAHDDTHASLSIGSDENGNTLLCCHAGCTAEAIVATVGKTMGDLYADTQPEKVYNIEAQAVYSYQDVTGKIILEKKRYPGKDFRWYRDNKPGLNGILPALYCAFSNAVQKADTVFWVEGEKDADTLNLNKNAAVCGHAGAVKEPTPEQLEPLRGKNIIVLPDNDKPGRHHAQIVAKALQGIASSVKVIDLATIDPQLKEKGDITDLVEDHDAGIIGTILEMAETAPVWTGTQSALVTLDSIEPQPPQYFWEPYIRRGQLNVIRGDGGAGKTMFVFAVIAAITNGKMPEGMPGKLHVGQCAAIYYGAEDDTGEYANRTVLCGCYRRYVHVVADGNTLPMLSDIETFRQQIKATGAKLIVFDPIQSFLGASTDMNRANEVRPLLDGLRALCRELDCTAIIVEHMNKATQQKAQYRGIGTVDITNASRSTLMIGYHPNIQGVCVAVQIKANALYGKPIMFSIDSEGQFTWRGECDVTEDAVANARRYRKTDNPGEVVDPVMAMVMAVVDENGGGWTGTPTQLLLEGGALVECSLVSCEAIGKRLPRINKELSQQGITWNKLGRKHQFTRRQQVIQDIQVRQ